MTTVRTRPTVDYDSGLKHCSYCDQWLAFDQFSASPHKNGGCGLRSYCKNCAKIRYPYKPRESPQVQPKQHIFDIRTRDELRQCSQCSAWLVLTEFFIHGRFRSNICKPCERENAKQRARKDVAKHIENAKRWQLANPDKVKERRSGYNKKYARANLDKLAEKQQRRRAALAGVRKEPVDRAAIIARDKSTCHLCGTRLMPQDVTLDHVVPLARGGSHTAANLRVACGSCNFSKQDRLIEQLALI